jgi:AraC-like DNA-binding protein
MDDCVTPKLDRSRKSLRPENDPANASFGLSVRPDAMAVLATDLSAQGLALVERSPPTGPDTSERPQHGVLPKVGDLLTGGAQRPPAVQVFSAYAEAMECRGDGWLGLLLGATRGSDWLGPFGKAIANMPTLRASIELSQRYIGLLVDGQRLELSGDSQRKRLITTLPEGLPPNGALVVLQSSVVLMANLFDAYVGPGLWPLSLCFACPAPPPMHPGRAALKRPGRRLQFGADAFGIEFPAAYLDFTANSPSASLEHAQLVAELEHEAQRLESGRNILDRMRHRLLSELSRRPLLGEVARGLGMSSRALQLHLTSHGLSFQAELARLRLHVARQYLIRTNVPLATISLHLGFQSPEAFSRFFREAMGESPRRYRQRERSHSERF